MTTRTRGHRLDVLAKAPDPDVVVIGGGINGISVYRELALQGLRVVLAEAQDYCAGASGALSRMIHGGLRYMENGEFDLVREALRERDLLLRNAPHFVAPLATTVPSPANKCTTHLASSASGTPLAPQSMSISATKSWSLPMAGSMARSNVSVFAVSPPASWHKFPPGVGQVMPETRSPSDGVAVHVPTAPCVAATVHALSTSPRLSNASEK